jgi:hypothetical protein
VEKRNWKHVFQLFPQETPKKLHLGLPKKESPGPVSERNTCKTCFPNAISLGNRFGHQQCWPRSGPPQPFPDLCTATARPFHGRFPQPMDTGASHGHFQTQLPFTACHIWAHHSHGLCHTPTATFPEPLCTATSRSFHSWFPQFPNFPQPLPGTLWNFIEYARYPRCRVYKSSVINRVNYSSRGSLSRQEDWLHVMSFFFFFFFFVNIL